MPPRPQPFHPNAILCALGFAAIGLGVGSLAGLWYSNAVVWPSLSEAERAGRHSMLEDYLWIARGMLVCGPAGAVAGMVYAATVRWRRRVSPNAE